MLLGEVSIDRSARSSPLVFADTWASTVSTCGLASACSPISTTDDVWRSSTTRSTPLFPLSAALSATVSADAKVSAADEDAVKSTSFIAALAVLIRSVSTMGAAAESGQFSQINTTHAHASVTCNSVAALLCIGVSGSDWAISFSGDSPCATISLSTPPPIQSMPRWMLGTRPRHGPLRNRWCSRVFR